jgi:hypothetical protein
MKRTPLRIEFNHGLGDCAMFAHLLQLYRRRGYTFEIRSDSNKALLWEAAGVSASTEGATFARHEWPHPPTFNRPDLRDELASSKVAWNLNRAPLPAIGEPPDLWEELCAIDLSGAVDAFVSPADARAAATFVRDLPRPIVLLHTAGTSSPETKSLPNPLTSTLYRTLLRAFPGSLVLLDWDRRVPRLANARVRHTEADWGHIGLGELAALMSEAALLIGVDSGPYYFASLTRLPVLGVFHHHYPACLTLPRANNVNLARAAYAPVNVNRRSKWNIVEYAGSMPTADEIALQAGRMLAGPRYGLPLGRDVMLQQWVLDWCNAAPAAFPVGERALTFDVVLRETTRRFADPTIVETGCIRSPEDWRAGYSSYLFGAYLDGRNAGRLISLDNDFAHCRFAMQACEPWAKRTSVTCTDSVSWLTTAGETIDVLYLDSLDTDFPGHADHALRETIAAEDKLSADALVVYDDSPWDGGWAGKGAKAIPYLLERGWRVIAAGYQTVVSRGDALHG